jgi:hypothetical protein
MATKKTKPVDATKKVDQNLDAASVERMGDWADEQLTRDERDEKDDPEFFEDVLKFETALAEEAMAKEAAVSTWNAMKAAPYYYRTTNYLLSWGVSTVNKD